MAAASIELEKDLYRIVPMGESHLDEVLAIEKVSFPTPWSRSAFLGELFDNQFAYYYVCLKESRVVGYAGMWIILDEAHVTNIAIHPHFRGRKLGKLLLMEIMRQAVSRAEKITLEVRPSNKVAQNCTGNWVLWLQEFARVTTAIPWKMPLSCGSIFMM